MPGPKDPIETAGEAIDTAAALEEISADLFGQEGGDDHDNNEAAETAAVGGESAEAPAAPEGETSAVEQPGSENSEAVQAVGAPSTWTKEAIEDWAKIPPRAQQEILKREQDMFAGIQQYKEKAELGNRYDTVVEPFRQVLTQAGVDPVELFQNFSANHYLLTYGTPQQKVDIAANLLHHYGIPLEAVAPVLQGKAPVSPEFRQAQIELNQLKAQLREREQQSESQLREQVTSDINSFAADPANIHFEAVASDMAKLIQSGVCNTLKEAYDHAVWANPTTRQLEVDRQTAEQAAKAEAERKARVEAATNRMGTNVKTTTKARDGTIPVGSLDDTLNETFARISSRG